MTATRSMGLCSSLLLAPAMAAQSSHGAGPDLLASYAYVLPLTVPHDDGVTALRLPQAVYLHSRSASMDDLRVFDRHGRRVPFAIIQPPKQVRQDRSDMPVRIFPLTSTADVKETAGGLHMEIRTDANGQLLSVASGPDRTGGLKKQTLSSLILEIASEHNPSSMLTALRFDLPAQVRNYTAQLWLEASNDLQRWDALGAAELTWAANTDAQTLSNNRMNFEPIRFRYARITWKAGVPLQFSRVTAESVTTAEHAPASDSIVLDPAQPRKPGELVYNAGLAMPVQGVGLRFGQTNVILPVSIGYYEMRPTNQRNVAPSWAFQPVLNTTFYRISQAGTERHSGAVSISPTHARQWVVRLKADVGERPSLRLSWMPATLLFLANGNGPYQMAFGRDKATASALAADQVAPGFSQQELQHLPLAQVGVLAAMGGTAKVSAETAEAESAHAVSLRTGLLWAVLLAGLALLAYFARTLMRQMDSESKGKQQ